jgi:hypothetical protein
MLFAQLFALALLVHEGLWLCQDGNTYFSGCFLPTLGLRLKPWPMRATHLSLMGLCAAVLVAPQVVWLYPALLAALSLVLASFSLRLSNHLVVGWFMGLFLCLDLLFQPSSRRGVAWTPFLYTGIQSIVVLTYWIAFLHKLNPEYVSPKQSCGALFARLYLENRRLNNPRIARAYAALAIYATLALELTVPFLLLPPETRPLGLCLAVLLHMVFGLLAQFHFSALMYAGLAAFIPPEAWPRLAALAAAPGWPLLAAGLILGAILGGRFGVSSIFRHRRPAFVLQLLFGIATVMALDAALLLGLLPAELRSMPAWPALDTASRVTLVLAGLAFLLNGLAPYLGLKHEFSLAMFSNLRPQPWRHFLWPARWRLFRLASYVQVERIEGLPLRGRHKGGWFADVVLTCLMHPDQWLYSSTFFHEGLRLICRVTGPTPVIRVTYWEKGERHQVADYARERASRPPHYLRASLFPYRLPLDPEVPHCA